MQQKNQTFSIKGMQRDLSESIFNSEYAYENKNIRITPTEDNTGFALVNEQGTALINNIVLDDPIGQCAIGDKLVIFCTKDGTDKIYLIYEDTDLVGAKQYKADILYEGNLNFSKEHPIEAHPYYENEELQKVYWVDGLNPFRFINVGKFKGSYQIKEALINAVPTLQLKEEVTVQKNYDSGMFAPGTIQYSFTYVKRYAQESAIFHTTPLYYISYADRGGNGEEKVSNSFSITINNLDKNFDYVRVYAQHRTSIDAAANTRVVADLFIQGDSISVIDTGTIGRVIPDTDLLFLTGEEIIPNTINSKANTLFLGNVEVNYGSLLDADYDAIQKYIPKVSPIKFVTNKIKTVLEDVIVPSKDVKGDTVQQIQVRKNVPYKAFSQTPFKSYYQYQSQLNKNSRQIKIFKYLDWYRFGIQVQYKTGKWSDVIYLEDLQNTVPPTMQMVNGKSSGILYSDKDTWFGVPTMTIKDYNTVVPVIDEEATKAYLEEKERAYSRIEELEKTYKAATNHKGEYIEEADKEGWKVDETSQNAKILAQSLFKKYDGKPDEKYKPVSIFSDGLGLLSHLKALGAVKIRPVVVYPDYNDREVLAQGVVNPTLYNVNNRFSNAPFSQSSWFFRPNMPFRIGAASNASSSDVNSVEETKTYRVYFTLYTCFKNSSSYPVGLHGISSLKLGGRIVSLDDAVLFNMEGESQVQMSGRVRGKYSDLKTWLQQAFNATIKGASVKSSDTIGYVGSQRKTFSEGASYVLDAENSFVLANTESSPYYDISDGKGQQVLHEGGYEISRYLRWVPFWDGDTSHHGVATYRHHEHKQGSTDGAVLGEIDNKGKLSWEVNIGHKKDNCCLAYNTLLFEIGGLQSPEENVNIDVKYYPYISSAVPQTENVGTWAEFRHNRPIPGNDKLNAEIQSIIDPLPEAIKNDGVSTDMWRRYNKEYFYVDQSIFTLHSPELEFDTSIQNIDLSELKFRIVGMAPVTSFMSDISITTKGGTNKRTEAGTDFGIGFYKNEMNQAMYNYPTIKSSTKEDEVNTHKGWYYGGFSRLSVIGWIDYLYKATTDVTNKPKAQFGFVIYPWQRNGSLINDTRSEAESTNWLDKKKMSTLRYSNRTAYLPNKYVWYADKEYSLEGNSDTPRNGVSGISLFMSNEVTPIKISSPENEDKIVYYGNYDGICNVTMMSDPSNIAITDRARPQGYPVYVVPPKEEKQTGTTASVDVLEDYNFNDRQTVEAYVSDSTTIRSKIGCRIKYKSTPHAVIGLGYLNNGLTQHVLPTFMGKTVINDENVYCAINSAKKHLNGTLWWNNCSDIHQDYIPIWYDQDESKCVPSVDFSHNPTTIIGPHYSWLWVGELYRDTINENTRFGGKSKAALANNKWVPCGEAVSILDDNGNAKVSIDLVWEEGDTYYQRYDHIKTYPFTLEDQNSVTDIMSFMVETRINIDGRYDRNRGNKSNLVITPEHFNQLNPVYSQTNNFFTYFYRDSNKLNVNKWVNTLCWTLTKTAGDLVDKWTHINMANTLDLDGRYGKITSIQKSNDQLLAFQDKAISMIMFNENMQISTTEGVPVEIGNSGKVNGYRILTDTSGCTNKWTIANTDNGIYFVDGINKDACVFSGGKVINIANSLGLASWFNKNATTKEWNPYNWNDMVAYYNSVNGDLYYITKHEALAYNTQINSFTSFYDYENTPFMAMLNKEFVSIHNNKMWRNNKGDYNKFFGEYKPFYVEVIANADRLSDKMFSNVDFRAETGNYEIKEDKLINNWIEDLGFTFNSITASNEYQSNTEELKFAKYGHSNLKRKFRIWRADIPRDKAAWNRYKVDRMRNPWLHLRLERKPVGDSYKDSARTVLHDINVTYYV